MILVLRKSALSITERSNAKKIEVDLLGGLPSQGIPPSREGCYSQVILYGESDKALYQFSPVSSGLQPGKLNAQLDPHQAMLPDSSIQLNALRASRRLYGSISHSIG